MFEVTGIFIYPIKGLPGVLVNESLVESKGLQYDRRWMLVDDNNVFISQRSFPVLSQFKVTKIAGGFNIQSPLTKDFIQIPFATNGSEMMVDIWSDKVLAVNYSLDINNWFSSQLQFACKLVYLPDSTNRSLDENYNRGADEVSFADGFPILIIGESSLLDLNKRMEEPIFMDRFRPNIVFNGGSAFEEDFFGEFNIGLAKFLACKPCARCAVTTINQQTALISKEPLKTLASFRIHNQKIYFGENVIPLNFGEVIKVGNQLQITTKKEGKQFRIQ